MVGFRKPTGKEKKMVEERFKEILKNNPDISEEQREKILKKLMSEIKY